MKFVGKTALIETTLQTKAVRLLDRIKRREPVPVRERRWLFTGPPGIGKTALGWRLCARLVGCEAATHEKFNHISLEHRNGSGVSVDVVRDWTAQSWYRPLQGEVAVTFIDEIDGLKTDALTDVRTYLDELPQHRIFLATTNRAIKDLQEQLQSRFQIFEFAPVAAPEISAHLVRVFGLDEATAASIAFGARGNVRAAEEDAQTELDVRAAFNQAA